MGTRRSRALCDGGGEGSTGPGPSPGTLPGEKADRPPALAGSEPRRKRSVPSIHLSGCKNQSVRRAARRCGLREVEEDDKWTVLWTDNVDTLARLRNMKCFQKINRFPGMMELCRKDLLACNLNHMLWLFPKEYNIFPPHVVPDSRVVWDSTAGTE